MSENKEIDVKPAMVLVVLLFLFSGCDKPSGKDAAHQVQTNSSSTSQGLKENIGWIHGNCLAVRNAKINPGTSIQVIQLGKSQKVVDAKVINSISESNSECFALLNDRAEINRQDGRFFYRLDINKESLNTMAIGLVAASAKIRNLNSVVEFDLNNDGTAEHADTCLTSEGVQFYISSNKTFDEKALWSDYYYLGYDNKPTCP